MKFDTFSARITLLGSSFLAANIEMPWDGEERTVPLRFHDLSRIEFRRGTSSDLTDLSWLTELVKRVSMEHGILRQINEDDLFCIISLSGELVAKGSGQDIDLARSNGLHFRVSHVLIEDSQGTFFQHERGPGYIANWGYLREAIDASYEKVRTWEREHRKGIVCS